MKKNGVCIICRENKDNLSDEHVIPDAIGGYYHIYTVCKECNSKLGQNIDSKLVKHPFTSFMRYKLGIKGKTGKIPNPFEGTHTLDNEPDTNVRLDIDPDGNLVTRILPKVLTSYDENGKLLIRIQLDKSDEHEYEKIRNKILKRMGINSNEYIINNLDTVEHTIQPVIKVEQTVEFNEFRIAFLKIAYEFAVDTIPGFFEENDAREISEVLLNANTKDIDKYFGNNWLDKISLEPFEHLIDFEKKRHILILTNIGNLGFVCIISLYNLFIIAVRLSETIKPYLFLFFGINDLEKQRFEKISISELTSKPNTKIFKYNLNSEESQICLNEDIHPIYDNNFNIKYYSTANLFGDYLSKNKIHSEEVDLSLKVLIKLDEELFIYVPSLNKYCQLISVQIEEDIKRYKI